MLFLMSSKTKGVITTVMIFVFVIILWIIIAPIIFPVPIEEVQFLSYLPIYYVLTPLVICIIAVGSILYFKYSIEFGLGLLQGLIVTFVGTFAISILVMFVLFLFGVFF